MIASAGGINATFDVEAENENAIHRHVNTSHSNAIRPIVRSVTIGGMKVRG
jgi:phosphomevalonate kinase